MGPLSFGEEMLMISTVVDILSKAIGLTFAYAVVAKMAGFRDLVSALRGYALVPNHLASHSAALLITCEGIVAISHISGTALQAIAPATLLLLSAFCLVNVVALVRGQDRPCLCFGANRDDRVDGYSLIRLSLLLLCEFVLYRYYGLLGSSSPAKVSPSSWVAMLLVSALAVSLVSWCLAIPKLQSARRVLDT